MIIFTSCLRISCLSNFQARMQCHNGAKNVFKSNWNYNLCFYDNRPHGMGYSYFGNEVRNGVISITQRGFIIDHYKVDPVGQWGKILVMAMGFIDHLGLCIFSRAAMRSKTAWILWNRTQWQQWWCDGISGSGMAVLSA